MIEQMIVIEWVSEWISGQMIVSEWMNDCVSKGLSALSKQMTVIK